MYELLEQKQLCMNCNMQKQLRMNANQAGNQFDWLTLKI